MSKITEILSQHSIDRETLAKAYKSVIGKALPARAATIKDDELAQIIPTFAPAGIGKQKKEEPKVFKAEELAFGDDFLS
jgi:hypothetical protein